MERYIVQLPIIRSNFTTTHSARFKGNIQFISNKHGVIMSWIIKFNHLEIDLYTTKSWFKKKEANFRRREELFAKLGLKQEERPKTSSNKNKTVELSQEQIKVVEDYFNGPLYTSTLKNIVTVLKGNSPGGEAGKPSGAEMIIDTQDSRKNFVIFFDDLVSKYKVDFEALAIGANQISFEEFTKLNPTLDNGFKFMQKEKDEDSWLHYLANIKEYYKKYNVDLTKAQKIADRARSKFGKNIESIDRLPFDMVSSVEFQKCHIYEFHDLRDKIVEALREGKSTIKYEQMISDPNNFLPFPEMIHRKFDSNYFTYKEDGSIWPINNRGEEFIEKFVDEKYHQIPEFFFNEKRRKYISKRNENIKW